jgi:DNA replicative helicase MCM subunit Mcm2 (Cdc46/Mcm family)
MRGGRGGAAIKESALHQLYLLANSLECIKSSGDRNTQYKQLPLPPIFPSVQTMEEDILFNKSTLSPSKLAECSASSYSADELSWIESLALSPMCFARLIKNFCPTIFGHDLVKAGLLLGLFGGTKLVGNDTCIGESNDFKIDSFNIRADVHVLGILHFITMISLF